MEQLDQVKFGSFVTELRKEKGMTQKELADLIHVRTKQSASGREDSVCRVFLF